MQKVNPDFLKDTHRAIELSSRLYPRYVKAKLERKAQIANVAASNYTLVDVSLVPKRRRPFSLFAERPS